MVLIAFCGFETAPNVPLPIAFNGTPVAVTGRDGVGKAINSGSSGGAAIVGLPSNHALVVVGVAVLAVGNSFGTPAPGGTLALQGDAGAVDHLSISLSLDGRWQLRRGGYNQAVIATGPVAATAGVWGYLEVKATIADAGGICIVRWNGVEQINYTGDTKNAGTLASVSTVSIGASTYWTIDDLYVCDGTGSAYNDFLGDRTIKAVRPAGNGFYSEWVGSDGDSVNNYQLVDEVPFSATDYVSTATVNKRDTYDFANVAGLATVDAVQVVLHAAKADIGARSIRVRSRDSGGTEVTGPTIPLSVTYSTYSGGILATGATGAAWTPTLVNGHEFGVESL